MKGKNQEVGKKDIGRLIELMEQAADVSNVY